MPRNGSGMYSLPAGNPVVTLTNITAAWANGTMSDIATALTGSIAKNGVTAPTANLPMAGFKHTGAGAGAVAGEYVTFNQTGAQFPALGINAASGSLPPGNLLTSFNDLAAAPTNTLSNLGASANDTSTYYAGLIAAQAWRDIYPTGATIAAIGFLRTSASGGAASAGTIQFRASALGTANFISCPVVGTLDSGGNLAVTGGVSGSNLLSGVYTPTLGSSFGITSVTFSQAQYTRVGNVVTVSGMCSISQTVAGMLSTFYFSVPIASTAVAGEKFKLAGVFSAGPGQSHSKVQSTGIAGPQQAAVNIQFSATSPVEATYTFQYLVE